MGPAPSDARIEKALRAAVQQANDRGELDLITVKTARTSAERTLKLDAGFFKSHETWKDRSKDVIIEEVVRKSSVTSCTNKI